MTNDSPEMPPPDPGGEDEVYRETLTEDPEAETPADDAEDTDDA